jgi:hypothetical protein
VGQKWKTKYKYRSKGRSPAKPKHSPVVVLDEGGNESSEEEEGLGDDEDAEEDDFQSDNPIQKSAAGVKPRLKGDLVKQAPNTATLEGKKHKRTPVDQQKSTASNTCAAKRGSRA